MSGRECSTVGCTRPYRARGYCITCYNRKRYAGELPLVLPRRTDDLCSKCRTHTRLLGGASYCRRCASDHARQRYRLNTEAINKRQRALYDPIQRAAERLRGYGLTPEMYQRILNDQGGVCAICQEPGDLHIDHDHACCPESVRSCGNCIRGLLCPNCNQGLGRFRDDTDRLDRAIEYLRSRSTIQKVEAL